MKCLLQIAFLFLSGFSFAQNGFTLSQGKTTEKGYLTTIPYQEIKEKIIIDGVINGKTYKFMLDTGAPMVIFKKLSEDLDLLKVNNMVIEDQSNKKDTMNVAILPKIKIGEVTFNNIPTLISDSPLIECFGIDGIIGSNALRNSAVQFSSKNKTIIITDSPKRLKLKSKPSKLFLNPQSNPYIWIEHKNGEISGREQLLFDTGMDGFYDISMPIYTEHSEKFTHLNIIAKSSGTYSMGIHGNADVTENYKFLLPEMTINNVDFKNIITETTYDKNSRIGAKLLKYGIVTVDYKNKKFYFEPFEEKKSFDLSMKEWPFNATMIDGKLAIGILWDSSLEKDIKLGDLIVQIDDINYEKMTVCDLIKTGISDMNKEKAMITLKDVETGEIKKLEIEKK